MKKSLLGLVVVSAVVGLVGCGEDKGKVPEPEKKPVEAAKVEEPELVPGQYYASEKGIFERRKTPAKEYPTAIDFTASYYTFDDTHRAYADFYLSLAKDTPDEVYVEIIDPAFRQITDVFARKDRVAELQPKVAEYKAKIAGVNPNVTITLDEEISVSPYNMETQSFTIDAKVVGQGVSTEWTKENYDRGALSFGVTLLSGWMNVKYTENSYSLKVDEATARKVEGYLSSVRNSSTSSVGLPYRAQGYVLDTFKEANNRHHAVVVMPERYELLHPETKEVLLTIEHKDLAPRFRLVTKDISSNVNSEISERYNLENGRF